MIDIELSKIIVRDLRKDDALELESTQEYLVAIKSESKSSFEKIKLAEAFLQTLRGDLIRRNEVMHDLHKLLNNGIDPDEDNPDD